MTFCVKIPPCFIAIDQVVKVVATQGIPCIWDIQLDKNKVVGCIGCIIQGYSIDLL
jgi:hypothetical protein